MHCAGLILARGASKGIPKKNISYVAGKPLLLWSLGEMQKLINKKLNSIWVSTDDDEIASVALEAGARVHRRGALTATDEAPSIVGVQEWLAFHPDVDVLVLVQCTSPLLKSHYLETAIEMIESGYDSVFAVTRQHMLRWEEMAPGESTRPLNFNPMRRPQRQQWTGEMVENGMFYVMRAHLVRTGLLQGGRCAYVEIPKEFSLDVNTDIDLEVAGILLRRQLQKLDSDDQNDTF